MRSIREVKVLSDKIFAVVILAIFFPIILIVGVLIKVKLGSPIFFKQKRPGKDGKIFTIYKFRTMNNNTDKYGELLADEQRLTKFGKFLRSTSLDELPQLFNVLKGDMSFVGPRALLVEYLPLYSNRQAKRHIVKPGITGWAQVNGRNAISWEDKFELDVWYVENRTFWLDMKILWMTFIKVIRRTDVNNESHVTMYKFSGSKNHGQD
ncbi:sugar transferase [Fastidiosibacter lacustris]|uniref:sugar transferase n=1 Tax=Fastidiosibacter lacustris TaxID=2056695 RepID=UPI000E346F57|nr:sugar transferase [Fastidiosibacter lacustris]